MFRMNAVAAGFGLAALYGCASTTPAAKLDDSGLSRLSANQMQPVDDARVDQGRARDALAKAKATAAESRMKLEVARSDRAVADAQLKRATAERDLLRKQYADKDSIARAENEIEASQLRAQAGDLRLAYLTRMIAVSDGDQRLAEAHVETTAAIGEQTKLKAMQEGNVPQASSGNQGSIDQRAALAMQREAEIVSATSKERTAAASEYQKWQELDARVRAREQSPSAVSPSTGPSVPR